jgi:hypothetical protein
MTRCAVPGCAVLCCRHHAAVRAGGGLQKVAGAVQRAVLPAPLSSQRLYTNPAHRQLKRQLLC